MNERLSRMSNVSTHFPRIVVAGTGGTIASSGKNATDVHNYSVSASVREILDAVPQLTSLATIECEQILNIPSFRITNPMLLQIGQKIASLAARQDVDGVVLTHGTDTLEETAYFLNLTIRTSKPIVVVGAMRPYTALSADGPLNLHNAVLVASSPSSRGKGVLVIANSSIFGARDVSKSHTSAIDAFRAPELGILGGVSGVDVQWFHTSAARHTEGSAFDISRLEILPQVDILFDHQSAGSHLYRAAIDAGTKGIVVAGSGNGSLSPGAREGATFAHESGVALVRASRTGQGIVAPLDSDAALGIMTSGSLNPQKARILLMTAIATGLPRAEMQRALLEH
jgi:L-asparaginase